MGQHTHDIDLPVPIDRHSKSAIIALAFVLTLGSKKASKKLSEEVQIRRLDRLYKRGHRERQLQSTYEPHLVPTLVPLGGRLAAVVNVLNIDPEAGTFEGVGRADRLTSEVFILKSSYVANRTDIFNLRPMIATALGTSEDITFNWSPTGTGLEVEVSKPHHLCSYPRVADYIGNDNHQILLPAGLAGERLITLPLDESFLGLYLVGVSRSGKTTSFIGMLQFLAMRHLPELIQFWVGEPQKEKAHSFRDADWEMDPHLWQPIARNAIDILRYMAAMIAEASRRKAIFEEYDAVNLEDYNRKAPKPLPRIIGAIDEPELLLADDYAEDAIRLTFIRMALIINRLCASQGCHLVLLPKSIAASEEDAFSLRLRRCMGQAFALKTATAHDGQIALQVDDQSPADWLGRNCDKLPGRGAAIIRHRGQLVRVQMLAPVENHRSLKIAGGWRDEPVQEHGVPTIRETFEQYANAQMAIDKDLEIKLAAEGLTWQDIRDMLNKGKKSKDSAPKSEPEEERGLTHEEYQKLAERYLELRKFKGMREAIKQLCGASERSQAFIRMQANVDQAIALDLPNIIDQYYDLETPDKDILNQLWGPNRPPEKQQWCLELIRDAKKMVADHYAKAGRAD